MVQQESFYVKNGEGTSLRESDFRQEQDYGIFHKTEVKNLMIDAENCD